MRLLPSTLGLLVALVAAPATTSAAARQSGLASYDGNWSVVVAPEGGNCDRAQRFSFGIRNGAVFYSGGGGVQVSGRVAANGGVRARLAFAGAQADVAGRLSATGRGGGRWSSSGSLTCTGRWTAQRTS